jgi:hypothetical protein
MSDPELHGRVLGLPRPWVAALGAPIAWSLHELLSYSVASMACTSRNFGPEIAGFSGAEVLLVLITLAAIGAAVFAGTLGYRIWRESGVGIKGKGGSEDDRAGFMGLFGVVVTALFLFGIVLLGSTPFFLMLRKCGA